LKRLQTAISDDDGRQERKGAKEQGRYAAEAVTKGYSHKETKETTGGNNFAENAQFFDIALRSAQRNNLFYLCARRASARVLCSRYKRGSVLEWLYSPPRAINQSIKRPN
jgi:hypothetical protein